jgi:hypothetical protein
LLDGGGIIRIHKQPNFSARFQHSPFYDPTLAMVLTIWNNFQLRHLNGKIFHGQHCLVF